MSSEPSKRLAGERLPNEIAILSRTYPSNSRTEERGMEELVCACIVQVHAHISVLVQYSPNAYSKAGSLVSLALPGVWNDSPPVTILHSRNSRENFRLLFLPQYLHHLPSDLIKPLAGAAREATTIERPWTASRALLGFILESRWIPRRFTPLAPAFNSFLGACFVHAHSSPTNPTRCDLTLPRLIQHCPALPCPTLPTLPHPTL